MLRLDGKLQFRLAKLGGEVVTPEALPPDLLFGPSRRPPSERVSSVFDSACISATSYEKLREDKWAERSQDSLRNPTKAMLDIMKKMKAEKNQDTVKTPKGRKRTKSFSDVDNTNSTPAMMEVMRLKKLKSMDDANEELLNCDTPVALLKLPFKLSPVTITKEILEEGSDPFQHPTEIKRRKTSKNKELKRLENFNENAVERRRTRSDAITGSRHFHILLKLCRCDILIFFLILRKHEDSARNPKQPSFSVQLRDGASSQLHEKRLKFSSQNLLKTRKSMKKKKKN